MLVSYVKGFILLFYLCWIAVLQASVHQTLPVLHEGRFMPADAYAKKWLYQHYHRKAIKSADLERFHTTTPSALSLAWQLHLYGHRDFDDSPFFWIHFAEVKKLLGLPIREERFSYRALQQIIDGDSKTSVDILRKLIHFFFLKSFDDPANAGNHYKVELRQLAPGLWVSLNDKGLILLEVPNIKPWNHLQPGMLIADSSELQNVSISQAAVDEVLDLMAAIGRFRELHGRVLSSEIEFRETYEELKAARVPKDQISMHLEQQHPFRSRLQAAGTLLRVLPSKLISGEWYSLHALQVNVYNPISGQVELANNFTVYSDELFSRLRAVYVQLTNAVDRRQEGEISDLTAQLSTLLQEGYQSIASKVYLRATNKQLAYPSERRLLAESLYSDFPFIIVCIAGYALALLLLTLGYILNKEIITALGASALMLTFFLHGSLLVLRSYILGRPPVSNMFETVLYVPWVATLTGVLLWFKFRYILLMAAAAAASLILLTLLQVTDIDSSFSNVQAVLDSQYWLIIHVLMVVGSYGIFVLGGVLGHLYLVGLMWQRQETDTLAFLGKLILQTMYIGLALLIPGTLLGGVWAAESWGRFWDWDPKESWAFISICVYLIWIHAYRFHKIGYLGLAIGSVTGLMAISFTWYGVNYVLGTGLHSYGFGSGGEGYYYAYLFVEISFLVAGLMNNLVANNSRI